LSGTSFPPIGSDVSVEVAPYGHLERTDAEGAEHNLLAIVGAAQDLSSLSGELALAASTWPELYSLARSRANILRALALDRSMKVLEVGCGCGALTRYLGESCGQIDAIEPVASRAEVARLRTRDQDHVRVLVGTLDDVPAEPAYDLIVVVGVLEYVASGAKSDEYVRFLARLYQRLADGGQLLVAIDNALGVKYLAGAPEYNSGRAFQSVEGYRRPGPARTFGRTQLRGMFSDAGFRSTNIFGAFPDYRLARAVFADELYDQAPQLAYEIPVWPSLDWIGVRARAAAERPLWMSLVGEGAAAGFANSHLAVARKGDQPPSLWPDRRLACFFSADRARPFAVQTDVEREGDVIVLRRRHLSSESPKIGPIRHVATGDMPLYEGTNLVTVLESAGEDEMAQWLHRWAALVQQQPDRGVGIRSIDLVPHNLIVAGDGSLIVIDDEWHSSATVEDVLARGALLTALELSVRCAPDLLPGDTTADVAAWLGQMIGLRGEWREDALRKEATLQGLVAGYALDDERADKWIEQYASYLLDRLATPLRLTPLGDRDGDLLRTAVRDAAAAREESAAMRAALDIAQRELNETRTRAEQTAADLANLEVVLAEVRGDAAGAHAAIDELIRSRSWRITAPMRAASGAITKGQQRWRER
jgi:SAM-dependent methyltransferase